jgi:DNA-binding NarL/FixJ family response regulator
VGVINISLSDSDNGLAAIRDLATRMKIVAVSDSSSLGDAALEAGATAYCDKDGNTARLLAALRLACEAADGA